MCPTHQIKHAHAIRGPSKKFVNDKDKRYRCAALFQEHSWWESGRSGQNVAAANIKKNISEIHFVWSTRTWFFHLVVVAAFSFLLIWNEYDWVSEWVSECHKCFLPLQSTRTHSNTHTLSLYAVQVLAICYKKSSLRLLSTFNSRFIQRRCCTAPYDTSAMKSLQTHPPTPPNQNPLTESLNRQKPKWQQRRKNLGQIFKL